MLTLRNLPWRNLKGRPGRTVALLLFAALMTIAVFGGSMMIGGVQNGLDTVKARLGADIMVTPESAVHEFDAQTVLLKAEPGYFYMDASVLNEVRKIEGVEQASPQLFLASAKASCCSVRIQMIAFDPETDFSIQPWIRETVSSEPLDLMDIIVGSNVAWVSVAEEGVIRFYDNECRVVGQFSPTGSTLDSAVYMNFDTCKALIEACRAKGMFKYENLDADQAISSVMIRVKPGFSIDAVAEEIRSRIPGISVATSTNMISGISESLTRISGTVSVLIAVLCALGTGMMVLCFTLMMNERRREFAFLQAIGASRAILSRIIVREALMVNLLGGLLGLILSVAVLYPFSSLIGESLNVGFVLPGVGRALLTALLALLSILLAAGLSAWITIKKVHRMDVSLVLKEGE